MNCHDLRERTVDYLYGTLDERQRAAFETHVAGCEACRTEVAALERTLGQTRTALELTSDEPPARVRAAVMEAARANVRHGRAGLWEWLRSPWMLPAFATASLMVVFVFTRKAIVDAPSVKQRMEAPSPAPAEEAAKEADEETEKDGLRDQPELRDMAARDRRGSAGRFATPPPAKTKGKGKVKSAKNHFDDEVLRRTSTEGAGYGAGALGTAGGSLAERKAESAVPNKVAQEQPRVENAPAGPAAAAPKPSVSSRAEPARAPAAAEPARSRDDAPATEAALPADTALPLDQLLRRADRAFDDHRWTEAAAGYRELLRRYPTHAKAPAWKTRIRTSEEAR